MSSEIIYFNLCTDASNLMNFQRHTHKLSLPPVLLNSYIYIQQLCKYRHDEEQGEKVSQPHHSLVRTPEGTE